MLIQRTLLQQVRAKAGLAGCEYLTADTGLIGELAKSGTVIMGVISGVVFPASVLFMYTVI